MKNIAVLKAAGAVTIISFLLVLIVPFGYVLSFFADKAALENFLEDANLILPITYLSVIVMFVYLFCSVAVDHVAHAARAYIALGITAALTAIVGIVLATMKISEEICISLIVLSGIVAIILNAWASSGKRIRAGYVLAAAIPALYLPICILLFVGLDDYFMLVFPIAGAIPLFTVFVITDLISQRKGRNIR